MNQDIQYIADTLLVEKVVMMDAAFHKEAGVLDAFSSGLSSIATSIRNFVQSQIDTSSTGAFGRSVLKLLIPATLFRLSPILGGTLIIASQIFNFDLGGIVDAILGPVKHKIEKGEPVDPQELDNAAKGLLGVTATGSYDFFADLRKLEKEGSLFKTAQRRSVFGPESPGGAMLFPGKQTSPLHRVFGFLGKGRSRGLIVGFILWLIKTVLGSALLLGVGGAAAGLLGFKKDKKEEPVTRPGVGFEKQVPAPAIPPIVIAPKSHNLQPSGRGERYHKNDADSLWIVPIYDNIHNTLLLWALDVYPELRGHENEIRTTSSFNRTANLLESYIDRRNPHYLIMPSNIHRIIDIVDTFAGDIAAKIKGTK